MRLREILLSRAISIREEHEAIERGEAAQNIIPTGLTEFDKRGGNKRKQVTLYGGGSGEGKSLWALQCARAAAQHGYLACVISIEDPAERSADRFLSTETGINSAKLLSGDVDDAQVRRLILAAEESAEWTDRVEWHEGVRTGDEALDLLTEEDYDLAIFDYLSALPHGKHGRERAVSDFMWGFTSWAQENNAAALAFAQLKNEVTERGLKAWESAQRRAGSEAKPDPAWFRGFNESDLMWCTDAGRNAKEVGYMQRPARVMKRLGFPIEDNVMEFNFPKRNWGAEGIIRVGIDPKTARFFDLPKEKR